MNNEIKEIFDTNINELRKELYKKYTRKQISDELKISKRQVSMLLNGKSMLSYKQYLILKQMLKSYTII